MSASAPPTAPRAPAGARWSCHSCGFCCRLFRLGPVEPEIIAGLEARDIASHYEPASRGPWYRMTPGPDGAPQAYLNKVNGACVFLREDNLCAIHALFGAEAKPGFCRTFPIHLVEDSRGLAAVARLDCTGHAAGAVHGEPLSVAVQEALALPRPPVARRFQPAEVAVLPGLSVPLARWMDWEDALTGLLEQQLADPPGPEASVAALRDALARLAVTSLPAPQPDRYRLALRAALHGVHLVVARQLGEPRPQGASDAEESFAAEMNAAAQLARDALASPDALRRPLEVEARRWLNLGLRGELLGKQVHALGSVAAGLGAWLLESAVARVLAEQQVQGALSARDLGAPLSRWRRFTGNAAIQAVLRTCGPALVDAALHAPA